MNNKSSDCSSSKGPLFWTAFITTILLLIPLVAMQFTDEVNWNLSDFVVMGSLCISMGGLFGFISSRMPQRKRLIGLIISATFLYLWAELAVGIFFNAGS